MREFNAPHLYIIKGKQGIKIGRSKDPIQRLKQLQTGNSNKLELLLIVENMGFLELSLHEKLKKFHLIGEWFKIEGLVELPTWIYEQLNLDNI